MTRLAATPPPLMAWYGDDYTGSAAVMEVLAFAGIDAVLFLDPPTPADLDAFPGVRAVGIAGAARSHGPDWLRAELPTIFQMLRGIGAEITLYKVCSTLDSSRDVGSIGLAIDLALDQFPATWIPVLIAAPPVGRWQAFGTLFARAGADILRLDRHPVMARHPVTPMTEADVALHLGKQTGLAIGCLMLTDLATPDRADAALAGLIDAGNRIITLDTVSTEDLAAAGRLIWNGRGGGGLTVGSQGVAYAIIEHLRRAGDLLPCTGPVLTQPVDRIAVVCGSVSSTTADQITWAAGHGFALVAFDPARVTDALALEAEITRTTKVAVAAVTAGQSALVHTARGGEDSRIPRYRAALAMAGLSAPDGNARTGAALGRVLAGIRAASGLRRYVIAGGDTSSHAARALGLSALTALAETVPGAAICTGHMRDGSTIEIALKGGQMGSPDYFGRVRNGGPAPDTLPHNSPNSVKDKTS